MRVYYGMPAVSELIDVIQHREGFDIVSNQIVGQTRISIQYRALDGRFVVAINGCLTPSKKFVPISKGNSKDCEIHYFKNRVEADRFWISRDDITGVLVDDFSEIDSLAESYK